MSTKSVDFLKAYQLSRPVPVQQLRSYHDQSRRLAIANYLASRYLIDLQVDVEFEPPLETMQIRLAYGLTWVYPVGQAGQAVAGAPQPANTIKVSANITDYPPAVPARSFTIQQHFALRNWLSDPDQGFIVAEGPTQQSQCIGGNKDAEDCTIDDLIPLCNANPTFEGDILHYGIALTHPNGILLFDSETLNFAKNVGGAPLIRDLVANRDASNSIVCDLLFVLKHIAANS